jgi:hypothetical protein
MTLPFLFQAYSVSQGTFPRTGPGVRLPSRAWLPGLVRISRRASQCDSPNR